MNTNQVNILEIMNNAIDSLKNNKKNIITLIDELYSEYKEKKCELDDIKTQLPKIMLETNRLRTLDKQLRKKLASASYDFSTLGYQHTQQLFEQADQMHTKLFESEKIEQNYIDRRNRLEFELKKLKSNIDFAEGMAQQLMSSLSYLQLGINELNAKPLLTNNPILTAFKCIEDEKARIARDLHDGPTQRIASIQMRIDFCKTTMIRDIEKGLELLDCLKQDLSYTLAEVREILFDLNPASLENLGLQSCVEHLLYNASDKIQIDFDFKYELDDSKIDLDIQNNIYRIVQELINNVKKHAQATSINLSLNMMTDFIYITFKDNGKGFTVPEDLEMLHTQGKSYGLFNIYTRIKNLNGILKINSSAHTGTCFKIQLPISLT